ncbi:hypothetical protein [Modestobacter marinus]|uniref:hypothetical protein n=1 Tax=Modestobacter marinus TaxID=477641 RepID=UPI00201A2F65|nr:hypothetical protein [Modestobacter marinus]
MTGEGPSHEELVRYRRAVAELVDDLPGAAASSVVLAAARRPEVCAVLSHLPGGAPAALERLAEEVRCFRPSPRSNAATAARMARIVLLQQVDVVWYGTVPPFADTEAVLGAAELTSLAALRRRGQLRFHYRVGTSALPRRARDHVVRRWLPGLEPRTSGLSHPLARPEMVAVLNEIADRFAEAVPAWRRGLWVNCLVRSTLDEYRLRELGYSALLPSAHCTGHAADIEMAWLHRHGVAGALHDVLTDYADDGTLNVIDEGQAWHVCLHPDRIGHYGTTVARSAGGAR